MQPARGPTWAAEVVVTVTDSPSQSDQPTLRSTFSSVRAWLGLLARYAWARPLAYRVVGVLAVAYTVLVAIMDKPALWSWLIGVVVGLIGWGVMLEASRLNDSQLRQWRAKRVRRNDIGGWLEWLLSRLPLPVARRVELTAGATLIAAAVSLILLSIVRAALAL